MLTSQPELNISQLEKPPAPPLGFLHCGICMYIIPCEEIRAHRDSCSKSTGRTNMCGYDLCRKLTGPVFYEDVHVHWTIHVHPKLLEYYSASLAPPPPPSVLTPRLDPTEIAHGKSSRTIDHNHARSEMKAEEAKAKASTDAEVDGLTTCMTSLNVKSSAAPLSPIDVNTLKRAIPKCISVMYESPKVNQSERQETTTLKAYRSYRQKSQTVLRPGQEPPKGGLLLNSTGLRRSAKFRSQRLSQCGEEKVVYSKRRVVFEAQVSPAIPENSA